MRFAWIDPVPSQPSSPAPLAQEAVGALQEWACALRPFDVVSGAALEELLETRTDQHGTPRLALSDEGEVALARLLPSMESSTRRLRERIFRHPSGGSEEVRFASNVLGRVEMLLLGLRGAASGGAAVEAGEALERLAGVALDAYRELRNSMPDERRHDA